MMSDKNKGILGFGILYTVLFVFDGDKLLASVMPSAIENYLQYLLYVVLALYGSFLFKDRLILQWNEIRKTKRKFFFGVLTGWLFLILMTVVFGFVSEMLRRFLGLDGQGLNQSNIQSATTTDSRFRLHHRTYSGRTLFPSTLITSPAEKTVNLAKHFSGRTCLCSDSYA